MRRGFYALFAVICTLCVASCGSGHGHVWVTASGMLSASRLTQPQYAETLHWDSAVTISGETGYYLYKNGTQVADVSSSPYVFSGLQCETTYTLGVRAHTSGGATSALFYTNYTTPSCTLSTTTSSTTTTHASCDLNATTSNFATQITNATSGDNVCLATGNYGEFDGTNKNITIMAASGASPTMSILFASGDTDFNLSGLTIAGGNINSGASNIDIENSSFTGSLTLDNLANAAITLDTDTFLNMNDNLTCTGDASRVHLDYSSTTDSGVIIENSVFAGGDEDGIQTGAPLTIRHNFFENIEENGAGDCQHSDSIQGVGASDVQVIGNLFEHDADGFVDFDQSTSDLIEDNACYNIGRNACVSLYGDLDSTVEYNTAGPSMSVLELDTSSSKGQRVGSGTIFENNVGGYFTNNGSSLATDTHNLYSGASSPDIAGSPTWQGGSVPYTWTGYLLTSGSTGHNASTDGTDLGIQQTMGGPNGGGTAFPLKVSANSRYMEDQNNQAFLMVGDSPQSAIVNLSVANAQAYFQDRVSHGFNTVIMDVVADAYTGGTSSGDTYDGIAPFTTGTNPSTYDLSTPNSTYFARVTAIVNAATNDGMAVYLDPIETGGCDSGGWMTTMVNNGNGTTATSTKDYEYGQYLGNLFATNPNVMWLNGNDFDCYTTTADNNDVLGVAEGIHAADPAALQSIELKEGPTPSEADQDTAFSAGLGSVWTNGIYTYQPTYDESLIGYNDSPTVPTFLAEAGYENENLVYSDGGSTQALRDQTWWAMTTGEIGQLYGNHISWDITNSTSLSALDTVGVTQMRYATDLLTTMPWWNLVPDQTHQLITSGYGTYETTGDPTTSNYVTDAETPDDANALAFVPQNATVTVAMSKMAATVNARWYDPTNNTYTNITGSPFTNTGTQTFTTPGNNSAGNPDWVLVLQSGSGS